MFWCNCTYTYHSSMVFTNKFDLFISFFFYFTFEGLLLGLFGFSFVFFKQKPFIANISFKGKRLSFLFFFFFRSSRPGIKLLNSAF